MLNDSVELQDVTKGSLQNVAQSASYASQNNRETDRETANHVSSSVQRRSIHDDEPSSCETLPPGDGDDPPRYEAQDPPAYHLACSITEGVPLKPRYFRVTPRVFFSIALLILASAIAVGVGLGVGLSRLHNNSSSPTTGNAGGTGLYDASSIATVMIADSNGTQVPAVFYQDPLGFVMMSIKTQGQWSTSNITGSYVRGVTPVLGTPLAAASVSHGNKTSDVHLFLLEQDGTVATFYVRTVNLTQWSNPWRLGNSGVKPGTQFSVTHQCCGGVNGESYFLIIGYQSSDSLVIQNGTITATSLEQLDETWGVIEDVHSMVGDTSFTLMSVYQGGTIQNTYAYFNDAENTAAVVELPNGTFSDRSGVGYDFQGQNLASVTINNGTQILLINRIGYGYLSYIGAPADLVNPKAVNWNSLDIHGGRARDFVSIALGDDQHFYAMADGAIMEFLMQPFYSTTAYDATLISNVTIPKSIT